MRKKVIPPTFPPTFPIHSALKRNPIPQPPAMSSPPVPPSPLNAAPSVSIPPVVSIRPVPPVSPKLEFSKHLFNFMRTATTPAALEKMSLVVSTALFVMMYNMISLDTFRIKLNTELKAEMRANHAELKAEMRANHAEMRRNHAEMRAEIGHLRRDLNSKVDESRADMAFIKAEVAEVSQLRREVKTEIGQLDSQLDRIGTALHTKVRPEIARIIQRQKNTQAALARQQSRLDYQTQEKSTI